MSAYIVDPRTIDYLVAWAQRHHHDHLRLRVRIPRTMAAAAVPECIGLQPGDSFNTVSISANDLGAILLAENVRSVRARYPNDAPDELPGPCDQRRVFAYRFRPITANLNPAWVIKAADCLNYQSCETDDWQETLGYAIMQAIREDAIRTLTDDAPWGISAEDLGETVAAK